MSSPSPSASSSSPFPSAGRRILTRFASSPLFSQKGRSIADFHIKAHDPHKQYSPGETVKGCVVVKVVKPIRVTHISVCLHGFAQVYRNPGTSQDQLRGNSSRIGRARGKGKKSGEYFGNGFASLFEDESVLCGDGRLDEGLYRFEFEAAFPDDMDLPSSIDFERGTISYMMTATLTRPTTIAPTISHDQKIYLVERVDIAPLLPPSPRTITLEPVHRKTKPKPTLAPRNTPTAELPQQPNTPSVSEFSFDSHVSSSSVGDTPQKLITATVELLKGACLRGDSFPVRIQINHTKHIKSINGIIITLYRQARVDMHPALPLGPTADGQKRRYEDYYPKSITGLGGLSLSGAGSSHTFRKDLSQILVPLYVDPISLTAEINAKIGVPHGAFPTITSVPGAMISFRYYIEIVLDIQGKLTHDRYLSQHGTGPVSSSARPVDNQENQHFSSPDDSPFLMLNGAGILDTAPIRRDKSVATCTFEVVVGTVDSGRKKGKAKAVDHPPQSSQHDLDGSHSAPLPPPGSSTVSSHDFQSYQHSYEYDYNYDPENAVSQWYDPNYDYNADHTQWNTEHEYAGQEYINSTYHEPPPMEHEESLPEKERLRRAEARLMPSEPPVLASASAGAEQASAPTLPSDDYFHNPGAAVAGSSQSLSTPSQTTSQVVPDHIRSHDAPYAGDGQPPPTDDKNELRRRQLELAASAPPILPNTYEEGPADPGPSVPLSTDDAIDGFAADVGVDMSEHLPRYHR